VSEGKPAPAVVEEADGEAAVDEMDADTVEDDDAEIGAEEEEYEEVEEVDE
jgi:hypothetical protein